jgi:hypothetical protein
MENIKRLPPKVDKFPFIEVLPSTLKGSSPLAAFAISIN